MKASLQVISTLTDDDGRKWNIVKIIEADSTSNGRYHLFPADEVERINGRPSVTDKESV